MLPVSPWVCIFSTMHGSVSQRTYGYIMFHVLKKGKQSRHLTDLSFIHRFAPSPQTPAVLLLSSCVFLNQASDATEAYGSFISQTTGWRRKKTTSDDKSN